MEARSALEESALSGTSSQFSQLVDHQSFVQRRDTTSGRKSPPRASQKPKPLLTSRLQRSDEDDGEDDDSVPNLNQIESFDKFLDGNSEHSSESESAERFDLQVQRASPIRQSGVFSSLQNSNIQSQKKATQLLRSARRPSIDSMISHSDSDHPNLN